MFFLCHARVQDDNEDCFMFKCGAQWPKSGNIINIMRHLEIVRLLFLIQTDAKSSVFDTDTLQIIYYTELKT